MSVQQKQCKILMNKIKQYIKKPNSYSFDANPHVQDHIDSM